MATVLIVEDDLRLARICRMVLQQDGHQAIFAENGYEALLQLRDTRPDVIVLDLEMPVMDGRSFFSEIQTMPDRPPVLILSGLDARMTQERLGAEASLAKPFDPVELSRVVGELSATGLR